MTDSTAAKVNQIKKQFFMTDSGSGVCALGDAPQSKSIGKLIIS
jgi:hypothetical protein